MVGYLLVYSYDADELINKILPYVEDKLDPDMVGYLLFYSSKQNRDELKKGIDDMKLRAKEQDEI